MTKKELAGCIDYTLLKPDATVRDIENLCQTAKEYAFASACIHPCHVKMAAELLKYSGVRVCTVIGFPLGANLTDIKVYEAEKAIQDGAEEIDMVINVGAVKSQDFDLTGQDIQEVVKAAHNKNALVKVILETGLLTSEEIMKVCNICEKVGADFVKTSTGFGPRGASFEDIQLMKKSCRLKIKAAGGIRNLEQVLAMIEAGADRIGCSAGKAVVDELRE